MSTTKSKIAFKCTSILPVVDDAKFKGPGPPDECPHTLAHRNLTGKSSNQSNSHDTTATMITTTCSACHSGVSLTNCSSTEESEREFDLSLSSPIACACVDCVVTSANLTTFCTSSPTANTLQSSLFATDCFSPSPSPQPPTSAMAHEDHKHAFKFFNSNSSTSNSYCSFTPNASSCAISASTSADSTANGSGAVATAAAFGAETNNFYCSTSAPTSSLIGNSFRLHHKLLSSQPHKEQKQQPIYHHPHQQLLQHQQPHQHQYNNVNINNNNTFSVNNNRLSHANHQDSMAHHQHQQTQKKIRSSTSDVSDTFDWWFHKHRRSSKKNRYNTQRYHLQIPF